MTRTERHQVGGVIITITPTRFTYLVTVEYSCTGQIIDEYTRTWSTLEDAKAMARNAYRWFAYRATLDLAA